MCMKVFGVFYYEISTFIQIVSHFDIAKVLSSLRFIHREKIIHLSPERKSKKPRIIFICSWKIMFSNVFWNENHQSEIKNNTLYRFVLNRKYIEFSLPITNYKLPAPSV